MDTSRTPVAGDTASSTARDTSTGRPGHTSVGRTMLSKVPEVTLLFWVVKILSTTVGETAADFLADDVGLGLTTTSAIMAVGLAAVLAVQFSLRRYVPGVYWLAVVMISIVGTLVSDNLVDNLGVSLWTTTAIFAVALTASFYAWWASEHTLSIHSIVTRRREAFYWLAILFAFALGTSAGDLISEKLGLGYVTAAVIFALVIAAVTVAHTRLGLGAVLAFWAAYVMTRPFGASIGDLLTAPGGEGGLGIGTNTVSAAFLLVIVGAVAWFHVLQHREGASAARRA